MWSRGISKMLHMWHFQFSIWLTWSFGEVHFAENPTWIGPVVPRLWTIEGFSEQWKTIEIHFFFWLYLIINAADFWLVLLDRNTKADIAFLLCGAAWKARKSWQIWLWVYRPNVCESCIKGLKVHFVIHSITPH